VVPDSLGCVEATASQGASHYRSVTGGGKASFELEQVRFGNTQASNIKAGLGGTGRLERFAKYAVR
jgi:hypothetical protein